MPNILFASNSVSHFPGAEVGGDPWAFDADRVPYSIEMPIATVASSPKIKETTTEETWFHFRVGSSYWYENADEPIAEIVDISGIRICKLSYYNRGTDGWILRSEMDGSSYTDKRYTPLLKNALRTIDIQIKLGVLQAEFRVYVNELLLLERSFPYNQANARKPRYVWIGGAQANDIVTRTTQYSEMIVADADTRNARLDLLRPIAAGAYNGWDGPLVSLSDDDPTTGMTTLDPNDLQSTVLTPYTGANNISNIVQVTSTVRGINSPANLQHLIRMSGVDYLTSSFAIPFSKEYQVTDWNQNPGTTSPWSASDLASIEFGFKSIA